MLHVYFNVSSLYVYFTSAAIKFVKIKYYLNQLKQLKFSIIGLSIGYVSNTVI